MGLGDAGAHGRGVNDTRGLFKLWLDTQTSSEVRSGLYLDATILQKVLGGNVAHHGLAGRLPTKG